MTFRARRPGGASVPARTPTCTRGCSTGARATIERIFTDYDGQTHLGVTIDDDPGQELMRETGRYLYFFAEEVEVIETMSTDARLRSILVAGVGNAWLRDDGFGGEVARRLEQRELPGGVAVMDAGTGGLDLAYEVMRGYDALVILDVCRAGRRARDAVRDGARRGVGRRAGSRTARRSTRTGWTRRRCCGSSSRSARGRGGWS